MMQLKTTLVALAAALPLGACASLQGVPLTPQEGQFVDAVSNFTAIGCALIPDAVAIASIVNAKAAAVGASAQAVADIVCKGVLTGPMPPTVHSFVNLPAAPGSTITFTATLPDGSVIVGHGRHI